MSSLFEKQHVAHKKNIFMPMKAVIRRNGYLSIPIMAAIYISRSFTDALRSCGVVQSYSRKKTPYDNSVCESFFHNMKAEKLYRTNYRSEKELRTGIETYIRFYNTERPHRTLCYMTTQKFEEEYARYHPTKTEQDSSDFDAF